MTKKQIAINIETGKILMEIEYKPEIEDLAHKIIHKTASEYIKRTKKKIRLFNNYEEYEEYKTFKYKLTYPEDIIF